MKRWAIIRLAVCYSLCVSIILSAFYSIISINKENEENQKSAIESGTSTEISEQQSERKQYLQRERCNC